MSSPGLLDAVTEAWRALVEFLVNSVARFAEPVS